MGKRKDILEGSCYRFNCTLGDKVFFARQMKDGVTSFYFLPNLDYTLNPLFANIIPIYSNYIHVDVVKEWTFIGIQAITEVESARVVKFFRQDFTNLSDCAIIIPGKLEEIPCKAEECVGLERSIIHESTQSLCEKLNCIITGVRTRKDELFKLRIPGIDKPFDFSGKVQ